MRRGNLVTVPQTELNQPRGNRRLGYLAERGCRPNVDSGREAKDRMVPNIKDIHAHLKLVAFLNVKVLHQREVPVLLVWSPERIAWRRTEVLDP